jgi:hypothetical protein
MAILALPPVLISIGNSVLQDIGGNSVSWSWLATTIVYGLFSLIAVAYFGGASLYAASGATRGKTILPKPALVVAGEHLDSLIGVYLFFGLAAFLVLSPFIVVGGVAVFVAGRIALPFVVIPAVLALLWIGIQYMFAPLCVVVEDLDADSSIDRSKALISGHKALIFRVVGTLLLLDVLLIAFLARTSLLSVFIGSAILITASILYALILAVVYESIQVEAEQARNEIQQKKHADAEFSRRLRSAAQPATGFQPFSAYGITRCPKCQMRIPPTVEGTCPSCHSFLTYTAGS